MAVSFFLMATGLITYFYQGTEISHFIITVAHKDAAGVPDMNDSVWIDGQYTTKGRGFYVGKAITITGLGFISDEQTYQQCKKAFDAMQDSIIVNNTEDPDTYYVNKNDIYFKHDFTGTLLTKHGVLKVDFDNSKKTFSLSGTVVCTKAGQLTFGDPLRHLLPLSEADIANNSIQVESATAGDQIESNRLILLLTFVTMSLSFYIFSRDLRTEKHA